MSSKCFPLRASVSHRENNAEIKTFEKAHPIQPFQASRYTGLVWEKSFSVGSFLKNEPNKQFLVFPQERPKSRLLFNWLYEKYDSFQTRLNRNFKLHYDLCSRDEETPLSGSYYIISEPKAAMSRPLDVYKNFAFLDYQSEKAFPFVFDHKSNAKGTNFRPSDTFRSVLRPAVECRHALSLSRSSGRQQERHPLHNLVMAKAWKLKSIFCFWPIQFS